MVSYRRLWRGVLSALLFFVATASSLFAQKSKTITFSSANERSNGYIHGSVRVIFRFADCGDGPRLIYGLEEGSARGWEGYWFDGHMYGLQADWNAPPKTPALTTELHIQFGGRRLKSWIKSDPYVVKASTLDCFSGSQFISAGTWQEILGPNSTEQQRKEALERLDLVVPFSTREPMRSVEVENAIKRQLAAADQAARKAAADSAQRATAAAAAAQRNVPAATGAAKNTGTQTAEAEQKAKVDAVMAGVRAAQERDAQQQQQIVEAVTTVAGSIMEARRHEREQKERREAAARARREAMIAQPPTNRLRSNGVRLLKAEIYSAPTRGGAVIMAANGHRYQSRYWSLAGPKIYYELPHGAAAQVNMQCMLLDASRTVLQEFAVSMSLPATGSKLYEGPFNPEYGWREGSYSLDCFDSGEKALSIAFSFEFSDDRQATANAGALRARAAQSDTAAMYQLATELSRTLMAQMGSRMNATESAEHDRLMEEYRTLIKNLAEMGHGAAQFEHARNQGSIEWGWKAANNPSSSREVVMSSLLWLGLGHGPAKEEKHRALTRLLEMDFTNEAARKGYAALYPKSFVTFGGIGVQLSAAGDTIMWPYEGGPAAAAGARSGDRILAIDGKSMVGQPISTITSALRGNPKSTLQLTVARAGESEPVTLTVTRDNVVSPAALSLKAAGARSKSPSLRMNETGTAMILDLPLTFSKPASNHFIQLSCTIRAENGRILGDGLVSRHFIPAGTTQGTFPVSIAFWQQRLTAGRYDVECHSDEQRVIKSKLTVY